MPLSRPLLLAVGLLAVVPSFAQKSVPVQIEQPKPTRDPQAINLLKSAVAAVEGSSALATAGIDKLEAIKDYRASGTVVYHEQGGESRGTLTLSGSGVAQYRLDENLASGLRSESADGGKSVSKNADGRLQKSTRPAPFMAGNMALPWRQLVTLLKDEQMDLSSKGLVQVDGRPLYQIRAQHLIPRKLDPKGIAAQNLIKDYFLDNKTLLVAMTKDLAMGRHHTVRYSEYKIINGLKVPSLIDEETEGQTSRRIQIESISVNTNLQKSTFDLSAR